VSLFVLSASSLMQAWPSTLRTVYGDHERYETNYFKPFPGYYFSGDGARRDKDGYIWITGRVDDVINVSGHRSAGMADWLVFGQHWLCLA
jgi:acyl-coenzyme A synthetase/AMP-(fatty) acid ligase